MPYDRSKAIRVGDLVEYVGNVSSPTIRSTSYVYAVHDLHVVYISIGTTAIVTDMQRDTQYPFIEVLCNNMLLRSKSILSWWRVGQVPPNETCDD